MAEFVVKLADERGRMHQQVEEGYSVAEVRDRFASQGYLVYWVKPQGMLAGGLSLRRGRKLKQSSFLVFNQQFLTLIKAGLPIRGKRVVIAGTGPLLLAVGAFCGAAVGAAPPERVARIWSISCCAVWLEGSISRACWNSLIAPSESPPCR